MSDSTPDSTSDSIPGSGEVPHRETSQNNSQGNSQDKSQEDSQGGASPGEALQKASEQSGGQGGDLGELGEAQPEDLDQLLSQLEGDVVPGSKLKGLLTAMVSLLRSWGNFSFDLLASLEQSYDRLHSKVAYFSNRTFFLGLGGRLSYGGQKVLGSCRTLGLRVQVLARDVKTFIWFNRRPFLLLLLLFHLFVLVLYFIGEPLLNLQAKKPYMNSLEEVADRVVSLPQGTPFESFYSPLRQPEYFLSIDDVIVQLTSTRRAPRVMGRFEFYVETNNRRALIEISDRQGEVVDLMQKVLGGQTWEELSTTSGKLRVKRRLRAHMNSMINYGYVREIYYKNLLLKKSRF